jgi:ABC-type nitrate/sulfonate/bicarbonate transport system permease component
MRKGIDRRLALALDLALLVLVWHVAASALGRSYLPLPLTVVETFWLELQNGNLLHHALASTRRILVGVAAGAALAAPLAVLAAESRTLDSFLSPLIYFLYPVPKIVFLPIIVFLLGLGDPSIVFLIAIIVFFQIYVIVRDAAAGVPPATLDSVAALGGGRLSRLRYVYLPLSLASVVTALKVSVGTAVAVLFIAESIGNNVGLGYYIVVEQWNRFAYARVYAGILAISLLGSLLFGALTLAEARLNRWRK